MKLEEIGEFGFIKKISRGCLIRDDSVVRAIGDDAAAFVTASDELTLVTTDLLVERVHFLMQEISGFALGHKALAVNLSDIAAMGGTAREAFVSIAIPKTCPIEYLEDVYDGMKALASQFDVNILGGDTTGSKADLVINIVVVGSVAEDEILCRNKAQPGDVVCSTGFLGDSRAGLHLILNDIEADTKGLKALKSAHLMPKPFLREGRFLARRPGIHAAIDVSDGLSSDIGHIADESGVGVRLFSDKIPLSDALVEFCDRFDFDPVEFALSGGEDYTLLCTISKESAASVREDYLKAFKEPLYPIGEILQERDMEVVGSEGQVRSFAPGGWDHFKV
ncbi:MAG: thiamine-phosphate kinase [Desulfatiglans sp.]|jgi:thiamine-monophosphate kinase|nr:thiamine-phosphate kinase [Desulfatiglans sp.]